MAQKNDQPIQRKQQIGEGSFGTVYLGSYLNYKEVAIKDIKGHLSDDALQEAKLLKKLTHQNIIQCYDIIQTSNQISIIMEFIDGGNLYGYIERTPQSITYWKITKKILSDIAYGMAYLHSQNIVHADLKSINVLLRHDYSAIICDFGLARTVESQRTVRTSSATGTVLWFAPELCFNRPERSSYPSDVWAYGCIILEVISKKLPWMDSYSNNMILLNALGKEENASIFENICMKQRAPKKLRALLCQCCTWKKKDRPKFPEIVYVLNGISESDLEDINNQTRAKSTAPKKQTLQNSDNSSFETHSLGNDEVTCESALCSLGDLVLTNSMPEKKKSKKKPQLQCEPVSNTTDDKIYDREHDRYLMRGPRGGLYYIGANGKKVYLQNETA